MPTDTSATVVRRAAARIAVLCSGSLLALMFTAVAPILPLIAFHLGGSYSGTLAAQLVLTMPSAGMIAGGLFAGFAVAQFGPRRVLLLALVAYATFGTVGAAIGAVVPMLASRALLGVAAACVATAATTLLAARFDAQTRQRMIGYQSSTGAVVGLMSTLLAGALAATFCWQAPFLLYLASLGIALVAKWGLTDADSSLGTIASSMQSAAMPWRTLLPLYLLCVPVYASVFITTTQVPFLLAASGERGAFVLSIVLAMSSMFTAIGAALYGNVRQRCSPSATFAIGLALMALGQVALALIRPAPHPAAMAMFGCAVAGSGAGLSVAHLPNLFIARVAVEQRGQALGPMYSAMYLGGFTSPLWIAPLATRWGRSGALLECALLLGFGALAAARRGCRVEVSRAMERGS